MSGSRQATLQAVLRGTATRAAYPLVDDKLLTKKLCARAGIPTPKLLAVAHHHFELRQLRGAMADLTSFVLKPAHGAMGNGILVIRERDGARFSFDDILRGQLKIGARDKGGAVDGEHSEEDEPSGAAASGDAEASKN